MHYEGDIYRPPSEAYSLIVQVTVGCSHNACTFCSSFKRKSFRKKPFETVYADLSEARGYYRNVPRIFFADGDAFCLNVDELTTLLRAVREIFPECERVGAYSLASQVLEKSSEDLVRLREMGLGILYIGGESGSDEVLRKICKGDTSQDIINAVQKAERAGIRTSVTFISGAGSKELMREHAVKTGEMISSLGASYVAFLSLDRELDTAAPLYADVLAGRFHMPSPVEMMEELELVFENINCKSETVFRSNHASNRLVLAGTLPRDKDRLITEIRRAKALFSNIPQV